MSAILCDDGIIVASPTRKVALRPVSPVFRQALLRFEPPGEDEKNLVSLAADGEDGMARWFYFVNRLVRRGMICYDVYADGINLATLTPISLDFVPASMPLSPTKRYVLSRFAYMHREGSSAVLESPLAHCRITLNDGRAAAVVARLASPGSVDELALEYCTPTGAMDGMHCLSADAVAGTMALLLRAGMIQEVTESGLAPEDEGPDLRTWAFHDLLFHARSRKGRTDALHGATYRFAGRMDSPPACKQPPAGEFRELHRPDLARLEHEDPPFAKVQALRRSTRSFDRERPLTDRQLGEFLYRVARICSHREIAADTPAGPIEMEVASRPYPSGGSLYEIEFYVAINRCAHLPVGLHYYDPARHGLIDMKSNRTDVTDLLIDAGGSTGIAKHELQVLVILAARVPRLAWKYESIAYSLILKHVGVLFQSMYLTATAMGLGACAVGGGDSDLFARAAGIRCAAETSVGEFLLGSLQPSRPSRDR